MRLDNLKLQVALYLTRFPCKPDTLWDSDFQYFHLESSWILCQEHWCWWQQEDEVGVVEVEVVGCSELHLLVSRLLGNLGKSWCSGRFF